MAAPDERELVMRQVVTCHEDRLLIGCRRGGRLDWPRRHHVTA